jgi:hypothetical protein
MCFATAKALDPVQASDADLTAAWHAYAGQISHHNADDDGGEWKLVPPLHVRARAIETEIRNRSLDRPTGNYLMTDNDRIDWETGEWSPGWQWKKAAAAKAGAA